MNFHINMRYATYAIMVIINLEMILSITVLSGNPRYKDYHIHYPNPVEWKWQCFAVTSAVMAFVLYSGNILSSISYGVAMFMAWNTLDMLVGKIVNELQKNPGLQKPEPVFYAGSLAD